MLFLNYCFTFFNFFVFAWRLWLAGNTFIFTLNIFYNLYLFLIKILIFFLNILLLVRKRVSLKPFMIGWQLQRTSKRWLIYLPNRFTSIDSTLNQRQCFSLKLPKHIYWRRSFIWIWSRHLPFLYFLKIYLIFYYIKEWHIQLACLLYLWLIRDYNKIILLHYLI